MNDSNQIKERQSNTVLAAHESLVLATGGSDLSPARLFNTRYPNDKDTSIAVKDYYPNCRKRKETNTLESDKSFRFVSRCRAADV